MSVPSIHFKNKPFLDAELVLVEEQMDETGKVVHQAWRYVHPDEGIPIPGKQKKRVRFNPQNIMTTQHAIWCFDELGNLYVCEEPNENDSHRGPIGWRKAAEPVRWESDEVATDKESI